MLAACPADVVLSAGTRCNPGSGDECDIDELLDRLIYGDDELIYGDDEDDPFDEDPADWWKRGLEGPDVEDVL